VDTFLKFGQILPAARQSSRRIIRDTLAGELKSCYGGPLSGRDVMTHKYRGCIVVLSINKSVKPNEEQKVLTSGFDQGFTVNTSKRVFRGI
jgi:hypothetical protein